MLLYDLTNDPLEMHDLAGEEQYKTKVKELFVELVALQKKMGDDLDLEKVFNK